jgi:hypothetical protein
MMPTTVETRSPAMVRESRTVRIETGPVGVGLGTASWSARLRMLVVGP